MDILIRLAYAIDRLNLWVGKTLSMLMPFVVLVAASVVLLRYAFNVGFPWLSEAFIWLNGLIFTLGAAYLLVLDQHVRVDVIYAKLSERGRAVMNALGVVFLMWPMVYAIGITGWPTVYRSILALEQSATMGGLPIMYLLKACIPLFCILVALQGLSMLIRAIAVLTGHSETLRPAEFESQNHV
ncbi:MAG: TRAP transporter small permease subunit [Alphaproteobacteria bacterium]|nr:TRAP transporter small permease subunit [Alphaproteobacteria bacterium]